MRTSYDSSASNQPFPLGVPGAIEPDWDGSCQAGRVLPDAKDDLSRYLQQGRDGVLWKLDGLGEHDIRRPLTPTGTNLLGLVNHLASNESGYFGKVFERPFPEGLTRLDPDAEPDADMWATAEESRTEITDLYRRTWAHSDATIAARPLDSPGRVPWWSPQTRSVTLHRILIHVATETHRHAGHADIVRELVDGRTGLRADRSTLPGLDDGRLSSHRSQVQAAADRFR